MVEDDPLTGEDVHRCAVELEAEPSSPSGTGSACRRPARVASASRATRPPDWNSEVRSTVATPLAIEMPRSRVPLGTAVLTPDAALGPGRAGDERVDRGGRHFQCRLVRPRDRREARRPARTRPRTRAASEACSRSADPATVGGAPSETTPPRSSGWRGRPRPSRRERRGLRLRARSSRAAAVTGLGVVPDFQVVDCERARTDVVAAGDVGEARTGRPCGDTSGARRRAPVLRLRPGDDLAVHIQANRVAGAGNALPVPDPRDVNPAAVEPRDPIAPTAVDQRARRPRNEPERKAAAPGRRRSSKCSRGSPESRRSWLNSITSSAPVRL